HQSQTAAVRTIVRGQSVAASRFRNLRVDRSLSSRSLGKLPGQLGQSLSGSFIGSDAGAIGSPPPFGDFGGQGPLNGGIEINQSIGPAEKDAVSLRGGAVCLCARCEYRPGARMMFVEQAQEAEFVRLAWCFEICEYDVNSDRIEDASRLIFTGGLDDLQP